MLAEWLNLSDALVIFKGFTDAYCTVSLGYRTVPYNLPLMSRTFRCYIQPSLDTRALGLIPSSEDRSARPDPCNRVDISYVVIPASIDDTGLGAVKREISLSNATATDPGECTIINQDTNTTGGLFVLGDT
jgi:hypothetical protein